MVATKGYRDKIYIVKDIIVLLAQYGQLNQTALVSYCGLNLKKHKHILDELESNGMIQKSILADGKRTITIYKVTARGLDFCRDIVEPYEELFPRKAMPDDKKGSLNLLVLI